LASPAVLGYHGAARSLQSSAITAHGLFFFYAYSSSSGKGPRQFRTAASAAREAYWQRARNPLSNPPARLLAHPPEIAVGLSHQAIYFVPVKKYSNTIHDCSPKTKPACDMQTGYPKPVETWGSVWEALRFHKLSFVCQ